jgi:hypothetical protein
VTINDDDEERLTLSIINAATDVSCEKIREVLAVAREIDIGRRMVAQQQRRPTEVRIVDGCAIYGFPSNSRVVRKAGSPEAG